MSRADFLLEIGCEEIPARMLEGAATDLRDRVTGVIDAAGLGRAEARAMFAPRRLAVFVGSVEDHQADRDEEILGPPVRAAFGPGGEPTQAGVGFAQKMGVPIGELGRVATPKGEYLGVRRRVQGRSASELLAELLPKAVATMSFPKTMRWGDGSRRFVRPVHWIVALLGESIVPVRILGVDAGRETDGHRILGARKVPVPDPSRYASVLASEHVTVNGAERRQALSRRLVAIAGEAGVRPSDDPELLAEVADLVEHPGAILGSFPKEFLALPREILITTLRHHQKSFSTETDDGLSNHFLVAADREADPEGHIRKGNEWVVVGRLSDARFFFDEDRKKLLSARLAGLASVTFHAKAGSYADKTVRVEAIALGLAESAAKGGSFAVDRGDLAHAARLAKCDLTTGLVGEFPELQGIAGGIYMRAEAEAGQERHPARASAAVYEQYRPASAGDPVPSTNEGKVLALADRLDSLCALARALGLPTGSKDPFGLRRAALAIVRIVAEGDLPLSCDALLQPALAALNGAGFVTGATGARTGSGAGGPGGHAPGAGAPGETDIREFLLERFAFWIKEKGARYDTVAAVLMAGGGARAKSETLPRLAEKVLALDRLREHPDAAALVEVHKRSRNILEQAGSKEAGKRVPQEVAPDPEEAKALADLGAGVTDCEREVARAMGQDAFEEALHALVALRPALGKFFDHVLVMHPDPATRAQRLSLIERTARMIEEVADLKQIAVSREEREMSRA